MAEKTLEAYLNEQEMEYQKIAGIMEKRKRRHRSNLMMFAIAFAVIIISMYVINAITKNNAYNELKDTNVTDAATINKIASSLDNLTHPDLFDKYEYGYLGNTSINALNYGLIAENQYGYTSLNENGETVMHNGEKENVLSSDTISQINIAKDIVIFKGADKKLYSCKHDGTDKKPIIDDKVGNVVLTGDVVYYVDCSKANHLYKYDLKDKKAESVIESDVNKFIVIADNILYTDYSNNLIFQPIGSPIPSWKNANVVKFYYNGDIYVQNNDKVIKFNIHNHFPEEVVTNVNELLGVDENNIYYSTQDKLYSQNLENGEKKELSYNFDYYKGIYSANGKITALGGIRK